MPPSPIFFRERVLTEPPRSRHRLSQVKRHIGDERRENHEKRGPEGRLSHDGAGHEVAEPLVPEQLERDDRHRKDGDSRDPGRAPRSARHESRSAEEDRVRDQEHELIRPPREGHRPLHRGVCEGRGDRAEGVDSAKGSLRRRAAREDPVEEENRRRDEMEQRERLERGAARAALRDGVQDDAHDEKSARGDPRDEEEEREAFLEEGPLGGRTRRNEGGGGLVGRARSGRPDPNGDRRRVTGRFGSRVPHRSHFGQ